MKKEEEDDDYYGIDIESRGGGVSINEVHENDDLNHSIVNAINEEICNLSHLSYETCIYKVPETLRCFNPKAYTPKIVSIGPIHHRNRKFKTMEEIKRRFLKSFLKRGINNKCLEDYVEIIIQEEKRLRTAYLEPIEFKSHEFVKIIMLDAAFIIEFLLSTCYRDNLHFSYPERMLSEVRSDLLLLENQIPFFILKDLFDPTDDNALSGEQLTIAHLFCKLFEKIPCFQIKAHNVTGEVKHCLDFMRSLYKPLVPSCKERWKDSVPTHTITEPHQTVRQTKIRDVWVHTPTITELHQAGVKFKTANNENLFAIKFHLSSGVLELPRLEIYSDFEKIIRNLMAYEQCQHYKDSNICDYAILMDDLINTLEDVDLLVKHGIIVNTLGDNSKVCDLFNNILKGIYWDPKKFYFAETKKDMIKYCKNQRNYWKANLKQNYFNTPWRTASVVAAISLLILTIIQTVISIMSLV